MLVTEESKDGCIKKRTEDEGLVVGDGNRRGAVRDYESCDTYRQGLSGMRVQCIRKYVSM